MQEPSWGPQYETGVDAIDEDHKMLFEHLITLRLAMMSGSGSTEVGDLLKELRQYAAQHFSTEEGLMLKHHYPSYATHKGAHDEFLVKIGEFEEQFRKGTPGLSVNVLNFLRGWVDTHLRTMDRQCAAHFRDA